MNLEAAKTCSAFGADTAAALAEALETVKSIMESAAEDAAFDEG